MFAILLAIALDDLSGRFTDGLVGEPEKGADSID